MPASTYSIRSQPRQTISAASARPASSQAPATAVGALAAACATAASVAGVSSNEASTSGGYSRVRSTVQPIAANSTNPPK